MDSFLQQLPNEFMIEVFKYLKFEDLCTISLTSKAFNEIVKKGKSMEKFRLILNDKYKQDSKDIIRKYQAAVISHLTLNENALEMIKNVSETVTDLWIAYGDCDMASIRKVLNFFPHINNLAIGYNQITVSDGDFSEPLPKLNLESLEVECDSSIIKLLLECSIKKFLILNCKDYAIDVNLMKIFFEKQKDIEFLHFKNPETFEVFNSNALIDIDLKVKSLGFSVDCNQVYDLNRLILITSFMLNSENMKKFLRNQKNLTKVSLSTNQLYYYNFDVPMFKILSEMRNVNELEMSGIYDYDDITPMPFIEKLTFERELFSTNEDFNVIFPNVTDLTIHYCNNLKFVENFTSTDDDDDSVCLKIPKVKNLYLHAVKYAGENPFTEANNFLKNIENLIVGCCDSIAWLIEYLKTDNAKLNSLKVSQVKIKKSDHRYLESLTRGENKKINKLKIILWKKCKCSNHDEFIYDDCTDVDQGKYSNMEVD